MYILFTIMSSRQKINSDIYYDRAGFGSKQNTLKDAGAKDKSQEYNKRGC